MPKAYVNGININYKVEGQGEPLILVMGFTGTQGLWFFQTRAFKKYYKVVTFDNRGVGKTDKPSEPYTVKTMADDTIGLMDHLGIDKAHILGWSMGGVIAQEIAINYPERVGKLSLAATFPGLPSYAERVGEMAEIASEALKAWGLREDFSEDDITSLDTVAFLSRIIALAFNSRLYRMISILIAKPYARWVGSKNIMGHMKAHIGSSTLDRLDTIEAPTLVIVGTEDKAAAPSGSEVMASRIPNAKLVKLEGGAHGYVMEMRGRFNEEVLDFLRGN